MNKVHSINGSTEISVWKGKQIIAFEYSLEADFVAEKDTKECSGSFKATEINESDFDFHIPTISITKDGEIGEQVKHILWKSLREEIKKSIDGLLDEIRRMANTKET